jgi:hypothetical protein
MSSEFIDNFTHPLAASAPSLTFVRPSEEPHSRGELQISTAKRALHALLASFPATQAPNAQQIREAVSVLSRLESQSVSTTSDSEEDGLKNAVIAKVAVGLYADALKIYLRQATEVEAEAEWWGEVERSRLNTAWYLLQSSYSLRIIVQMPAHIIFQPHRLDSFRRLKQLSPPFAPKTKPSACPLSLPLHWQDSSHLHPPHHSGQMS